MAGKYGLEPNWDKTQHMRIQHEEDVLTPSGGTIGITTQATYLGSLLAANGSSSLAVGRRIGEATSVFNALCDVWKHANICKQRKVEIFNACVVSKLSFSLECEALRQKDKDRLNAFQCKCLRRILKIPPSWISHVPNNVVLAASGTKPLVDSLLFQQLVLFGKIAKLTDTDFLRQLTFEPSSIYPSKCMFRRRGRPRLAWQSVLHGLAISSAPQGADQISNMLIGPAPISAWKRHLAEHF